MKLDNTYNPCYNYIILNKLSKKESENMNLENLSNFAKSKAEKFEYAFHAIRDYMNLKNNELKVYQFKTSEALNFTDFLFKSGSRDFIIMPREFSYLIVVYKNNRYVAERLYNDYEATMNELIASYNYIQLGAKVLVGMEYNDLYAIAYDGYERLDFNKFEEHKHYGIKQLIEKFTYIFDTLNSYTFNLYNISHKPSKELVETIIESCGTNIDKLNSYLEEMYKNV